MRFIACLFLFVFFIQTASAEYRVFRLVIAKRAPAAAEAPEPPTPGREVTSTLDPDQYPSYYQVQADEVVTYSQTWMCRGRTGDLRQICPAPEILPVPATSSEAP